MNESPINVLKYLPDTEKRVVVLIDEVQYLSDPSNLLKFLYDDHSHQVKIVATGSSAFYIDDKFISVHCKRYVSLMGFQLEIERK